jgi:hypothetical protein
MITCTARRTSLTSVARVLSGRDASPELDGAALRIGWDGRTADGRPAVSNRGDGAGSFGATVTVATGWQHCRALF